MKKKTKKRILIACAVALVVLLLGWGNIRDYISAQKHKAVMAEDFDKLFITERASVAALYEALDNAIQTPDEISYSLASAAAEEAWEVVADTHMRLDNDGVIISGADQVYVSTFFRDIKAQLASGCDTQLLSQVNDLLGQLLVLYDHHAASAKEKRVAMNDFFHELRYLQEDMTKFVL